MPEIGYEPPTERAQGHEGEQGAGDYYAGLGGREGPGAESNLGFGQEALRGSGQAAEEIRPGSLTADQIREQIAAPETIAAIRADVERAIDQAAQKGEALQMPIGVDYEKGSWSTDASGYAPPIFGKVADQLAEVDRMNELTSQIMECATPGAMQAAAE
jgi:hypothetical protein